MISNFLKKRNMLNIIITISLIFQTGYGEAAMASIGGAGVLSSTGESSIEKNGLAIKAVHFYSQDATEKYYRNNLTQTGVIPVSVKITNNSQIAQTFLFKKATLSSDGISDAAPMTVRTVMERTKEGADIGIVMNLIFIGIIGVAFKESYTNDVKSIRFDEVEEAIVNDKVDPVVTLKPGESINGVLFFNGLIDAGDGKVAPIGQITNGQLQLVVNNSTGNDKEEKIIVKI